jgi:hypothetical protein
MEDRARLLPNTFAGSGFVRVYSKTKPRTDRASIRFRGPEEKLETHVDVSGH